MLRSIFYSLLIPFLLLGSVVAKQGDQDWVVDNLAEWQKAEQESEGLVFDDGLATPTGETSHFRSIVRSFDKSRSAKSIVFEQSPVWHNWNPTENLGPLNLQDAPVLLTRGPDNYWMFGRYGAGAKKKRNNKRKKQVQEPAPVEKFESQPATLEGFDVPLRTTRYPNQFDAPGGLE